MAFGIRAGTLCTAFLLAGCDTSTQAAAPPHPAVAAETGGTERAERALPSLRAVLETTAPAELQALALREDAPVELRYAALRRLEELGAPQLVPTAEALARSPAPLLADNALGALGRCRAPEAAAALARLGPEAQALAARLAGGAR